MEEDKFIGDANKKLTEAMVEEWCLANPDAAKELGMRLITNAKTPEKLDALPSLGKMQDQMTAWAKRDPKLAQAILLRLLPKIMAASAKLAAAKK